MVINGGARAGAGELAAHLLRTDSNEQVHVLELRGVAGAGLADGLTGALSDMEASAGSARSRRPLYHANINTAPDERLTVAQKHRAVDRLEADLGLTGQPRAVVEHVKHGRAHLHVVWLRIDLETMRAIPDSHNYRVHEQVARDLEREFGHEHVQGAHIDREGVERPERTPTKAEMMQATRSGLAPEAARAALRQFWERADSGQAFAAALDEAGWILARGDRRDVLVALDPAGETHALNKKVTGLAAKDVRARLTDLDAGALPGVDEARAAIRARPRDHGHDRGRDESREQPGQTPEAEAARDRESAGGNAPEAPPPEPTLTAERMAADEQEETRRRDRPRHRGMDAEIATALWQLSKTSPGLVGAIFVTPGGEAWRREDFPIRFALDREALAPQPVQEPGREAGQARDPAAERRIWVERLREAAGPLPDAPHIREGQAEARDHADRLRDEARDAALFGGDPDRAARLREEADGILARDGLDRDGRPVPRPNPVAERRIWVERLREAAGPRPDDPRMRELAAPPPREAQAGGPEAEATPLAGAAAEAAHRPSHEARHSPDPARTPETVPSGPERPPQGAAAEPPQSAQTWLRKALDAARERLDALGDRLDSAFGRIRERFLRQADREAEPEKGAKRPEARPEVRETHRAEPRPPPVPEASRDPPPRSRSPIADEMLAAGRKAAAEREASLTPQQREAQREVRAARHQAAAEREIRGPVREIGGEGAGGAANGAGRSRYRHQAAPVTLRDGRRPYRTPARASPAPGRTSGGGGGAMTGAKPDGWEQWTPSQRLAWTLAQQWIAARRREFDL